ncbi:MAG: PAS domain-containing protein [Alphaproteobacteria bacterium]|nr:MAG: PAS domain-containing protein [Alphaproteobacteria bacterium]
MLKWSNTFSSNVPEEIWNLLYALDQSSIVAVSDFVGNITHVNDKFCEISKYNRKELIGQNPRVLKSGHHSDKFFRQLWSTISSGKSWSGEIKNRAKDGSYYWVFADIIPFFYKDGTPPQYVAIKYDITDKKLSEKKVITLKLNLEQVKIERESRERFLSTFTHDLKTPLTVAKLSAQSIKKNNHSTEKIKMLSDKIAENVDRADCLITEFLDNNRIRCTQSPISDFVKLDMLELVTNTIENLVTIHGDRFRLESHGDLTGYWNLIAIKRILENLISNAVKYGDRLSPILIKIIDQGDQVVLSVTNVGDPISENDQRNNFEYLHRTSRAEESGTNGWGLGLTVVKQMTEYHGGVVRVISDSKSAGTTFTVNLPRDSRVQTSELETSFATIDLVNDKDNFLRLFRHMPEILVILKGPNHIFEFVNDAFLEIFGINSVGKTFQEMSREIKLFQDLDEVYRTGIPYKVKNYPLVIDGETRHFNHTGIPRRNTNGDIIGIVCISSEVFSGAA